MNIFKKLAIAVVGSSSMLIGSANADQVILDDLIVDGSACVGLDCVNGESFGFDTLRLKENNLRIKFEDTSTSASFPSTDWQLTANDSSNGGQNRFSIEDITASRNPFTIEGGAPNHSLYVDDGGRVGFGTNTPVVELHVKDGDTPTLRLEQDGSSGFTPQTWDVAGNESGFFIRDSTNGSLLSLRIRPGAPASSIDIAANGNVGVGTSNPSAPLHVRRTNATAKIFVEEASGTTGARELSSWTNNGDVTMSLVNSNTGQNWAFANLGSDFRIITPTTPGVEFALSNTGDLTILGDINSGGTTVVPDYVFEDDYKLMPLDELNEFIEKNGHLPNVPSAAEVKQKGQVNMSKLQMTLLEKVEELTLYTLQQEKIIKELVRRLGMTEAETPSRK